MLILRSLASAFLMYSRIPVPRVEWKEENRRYSLCFFPLIGAVIGGLLLLWYYICGLVGIGDILRGAVSVLLPVLVTGGIHIDGFCDTTDALSSYADRQKRLEIMSDPHTGSFAVISLCSLFVLQLGLFCEADSLRAAALAALGYILSRSASGIAAVTLRSAKSEGSLQNFVRPAHKRITLSVLTVTAAVCSAGMILISPLTGAVMTAAAAVCFALYRYEAYRSFGGITGDTEGHFLEITETVLLAAVFAGERLSEVLAV